MRALRLIGRRALRHRSFQPKIALSAALAGFALCSARAASPQVNVEPLRQELRADGLGGRIAATLAGYAGNAQGVVLGANALLGGRSGRHFGYATANADYTRMDGATQVAKSFAHTRHNYQIAPWVWSELFAQLESDRFRRIAVRELIGAGPRFGLEQSKQLQLFYGVAYLVEYTRLNAGADVVDRTDVAHRLSNYLAMTATFTRDVVFTDTLYFQPRFADAGDFHLLNVANLRFGISERLTSRIDATLRYESRPPPDTGSTDVEIKNALELRF